MPSSRPSSHRRFSVGVLPARRLLAVDAGSQTVKILLLQEVFGRLRILNSELLEPGDDEDTNGDCLMRVRAMLDQVGDCPVALALPHYRALSQVLELPSTQPDEVRAAIDEEAIKLSGLGESQMVHDYSRLMPFGRHEHPFWVTFCPEGEVQRQIGRCGLADLELCEVTTTANGLVAAYQAAQPASRPAALLDVGASGTLVTLILDGQPVYSVSHALGGELWVELLAAAESCTLTEGRRRLREFGFHERTPAAVLQALRRWHNELKRLLDEWLNENPDLELKAADFDCVLAGGGAELPGLMATLQGFPGLRFVPWPQAQVAGEEGVSARFAAAYGAALHALGRAQQSASLLPDDVRLYWKRNHLFQGLQSFLFLALMLLAVALGFGTWQKVGLLVEKKGLHEQGLAALSTARSVVLQRRGVTEDYDRLLPTLQRQRETVDTLATLGHLPVARSNLSVWFVLFAGRRDYFVAAPFPSTNTPAAGPSQGAVGTTTRGGYIVELTVPELGEAGRRIVGQVTGALRASGRFANVDSLPEDRRRPLADPAVLIPGGHYALELEPLHSPFALLPSAVERPAPTVFPDALPEPEIESPATAEAPPPEGEAEP